jgi:alkaline phosphatase
MELTMRSVYLGTLVCLVISTTGCLQETKNDVPLDFLPQDNAWFVEGRSAIESKREVLRETTPAKNVILFVGDGMGISTVTAARIYAGQQQGMSGEENLLSFEKFPFTGLSKTYNVDAQTPDSAGTMTAMMSGVKTDAGIIGLAQSAERGLCHRAEDEVPSALLLAELAGKKTGIITTARLTHATPAATYAYSSERNWEDISDMPVAAIEAGCEDIASQFLSFRQRTQQDFGVDIDGIEVAFGGGRRHFLPGDAGANTADARSATEGDRTDGRNLMDEWQSQNPDGHLVIDEQGFNRVTSTPVLGLFEEAHMRFEADRHQDTLGEPSLSQMTEKAIQLLSGSEEGFFLMVESGRIDHAHHAGNAFNALNETREFSDAVALAESMTSPEDTLIIVTADHSHVFTIAGYPKRGNPILGKVVAPGETEPTMAGDGLPYTTLGYMNGRGHHHLGGETDAELVYEEPINAGRKDITGMNTEAAGYHQEALIPRDSETHGGEDVAIYATGPGAAMVSGVNEQNVIFHVMDRAANLSGKAAARLSAKQ